MQINGKRINCGTVATPLVNAKRTVSTDTNMKSEASGHRHLHREHQTAEVPLGGSHQILDARLVRRPCEELGFDWSQLPEPNSRV